MFPWNKKRDKKDDTAMVEMGENADENKAPPPQPVKLSGVNEALWIAQEKMDDDDDDDDDDDEEDVCVTPEAPHPLDNRQGSSMGFPNLRYMSRAPERRFTPYLKDDADSLAGVDSIAWTEGTARGTHKSSETPESHRTINRLPQYESLPEVNNDETICPTQVEVGEGLDETDSEPEEEGEVRAHALIGNDRDRAYNHDIVLGRDHGGHQWNKEKEKGWTRIPQGTVRRQKIHEMEKRIDEIEDELETLSEKSLRDEDSSHNDKLLHKSGSRRSELEQERDRLQELIKSEEFEEKHHSAHDIFWDSRYQEAPFPPPSMNSRGTIEKNERLVSPIASRGQPGFGGASDRLSSRRTPSPFNIGVNERGMDFRKKGFPHWHDDYNRNITFTREPAPRTPMYRGSTASTEETEHQNDGLNAAIEIGKLTRKMRPSKKVIKETEERLRALKERKGNTEAPKAKFDPGLTATPPGTPGMDDPDDPNYQSELPSDPEEHELKIKKNDVARIENNIKFHKQRLTNHLNQKITSVSKVFARSKELFIEGLFRSIRKGKLDDVQARVVMLDLQGEDDEQVQCLKNRKDHSPLQFALLFDQAKVAQFLVDHSGDLVTKQIYSDDKDYKLSPLHMALYLGNSETVEKIVESIPTPHEQKTYVNQLIEFKSYEGRPYGELPLAASTWSCMRNNKDLKEIKKILDCLVSKGAKLDMRTKKHKNTLLHLIVLQAVECTGAIDYFKNFLTDCFEPAAKKWWKQTSTQTKLQVVEDKAMNNPVLYLMRLTNEDGLTPLALAAKVESPLYVDLVQWNEVMRYPDSTGTQYTEKAFYNITDIASIDQYGNYRDKSVMHVLAHNNINLCSRNWHFDIVGTEPMKTIIKKKWMFYQWFFYLWGLFHLLFMILFTYFSLHDLSLSSLRLNQSTNSTGNQTANQGSSSNTNPAFCVFIIVPILYFIFELCDFINMCGSFELRYTITGNAVYRVICVIFTIFTVSWFITYMVGNVNQDILLSLSLLFGWIYCIFFTRTMSFPSKESQIGAFSIMVQRMLFHDLIPFLLISFFIIVSFSTAMQATLMFTTPPEDTDLSFRHTFYQMLKYFAALDDPMGEGSSRELEFARVLLAIYGIIIVVLLINMLIAAMNKSYDIIRETRCDLVGRQRLAILLLLERRLFGLRLRAQRRLLDDDSTVHNTKQDEKKDEKPKEMFITIIHRSIVGEMMKRRFGRSKEKHA